MEVLRIEATADTPAVYLDKHNNIFEIAGRSLPEDTLGFYQPVAEWLSAYARAPRDSTEFIFKLDYFNTSSSKAMLDIIALLANIKGTRIVWYSQEDDEDVRTAGEEFSEQVDIPFYFRSY